MARHLSKMKIRESDLGDKRSVGARLKSFQNSFLLPRNYGFYSMDRPGMAHFFDHQKAILILKGKFEIFEISE